ncbi:MAG: hypothetical protein H6819_06495 [Phycisphaerales bacterium]|nr:hypothetical protein [Phycisphaerales bacterium]MCB9855229.1 hypothetical protein [Phycisphaerales bacterium]MCB9862822.1 hypothetical protein [Phycisphaerales bacterium]
MSAGGFANTLRRTLAIALTLLTMAVGVLWADSYRLRHPTPEPGEGLESVIGDVEFQYLPSDPAPRLGLGLTFHFNERISFRIRSWPGNLRLACDLPFPGGSPTRDVKLSWGGFRFERWDWVGISDSISTNQPLGAYLSTYRGISMPFWALLLVSSLYPIVFVLQGPLRRRRRMRGQCLACGYDLAHSPHRCPECGTKTARASLASHGA